jgi:hypothetical protein
LTGRADESIGVYLYVRNHILAMQCPGQMNCNLGYDICGIRDILLLNSEVDGLTRHIVERVPDAQGLLKSIQVLPTRSYGFMVVVVRTTEVSRKRWALSWCKRRHRRYRKISLGMSKMSNFDGSLIYEILST